MPRKDRKRSPNGHRSWAPQASRAILALEITNGIRGSGWVTMAPCAARDGPDLLPPHVLPQRSERDSIQAVRRTHTTEGLSSPSLARVCPGRHPVAAPGLRRGEPHPRRPLLGPVCLVLLSMLHSFYSPHPPPFVVGWVLNYKF